MTKATLSQLQRQFTLAVAAFILWAQSQGYELTFGEAYRTPEQAALNAANGTGIANSVHTKRLAIDLNLFIKDFYRTDSEAYRPLGEKWKQLHPLARWGGDFAKPDGNHFSFEWEGVK